MGLLSNAKWNGFSQIFKVSVQLINLVYLSKIIPPSDYGLLALAAVVVNLGILLRDLGTSSAIIQKKELGENIVNSVFWLNFFLGFALMFVLILAAPFISNFYHQPELFNVLLSLSLTFPLSSCAATHLALMERDSQFKKISLIEILSSSVSVVIAVVFANLGFGVYSLVLQAVVLNLLSAILFWFYSCWRPVLQFNGWLSDIKEIFSFSFNVSLFNIVNYFSRNADSFFIGKFMSVFVLGNYNLAYRIMLFPLQSLTFVASRSLYPVLSKKQDDIEGFSKIYYNCLFVILMITAPLMSSMAILSEPFVRIVFGEQWALVGEILKWLAPTAIIQSVISTTGAIFMARNRPKLLLKFGIIGAFLQVSSFIVGVRFDIITFSICYFVANLINFPLVMNSVVKLINGSLLKLSLTLLPVILSTIILILSLYYITSWIYLNTFFSLVYISVLGLLIYIFALVCLSSVVREYVFAFMAKLKKIL